MKKIQTIIVASFLVMGMVLCGPAFADGQGKGDRQGFGFKQRHKGGGLMLLAIYQQKNLAVQVLSDLTKQSAEAVSAKLKEQGMRAVMQDLNVDRQVFRNAMKAKVNERIRQAAVNKSITPEQEKEILTKMENRSKRRELMSQLIEKGIKDGTITQEDAQMLLRKRR
jgi:hypothetical protein